MFFIYIYICMYVRIYTYIYIYVYIHRRSTLASDDNHNSLRTRVSSASFFLLLLPNEPWWPCLRFVPNIAHFFPLLPYLPSNDALYARPISLSLSLSLEVLLTFAHLRAYSCYVDSESFDQRISANDGEGKCDSSASCFSTCIDSIEFVYVVWKDELF